MTAALASPARDLQLAPPVASAETKQLESASPAERASSSSASQHGEDFHASTIMVIDDEPINVKVAQKQLAHAGYKSFVSVTDSRQAMRLLGQCRPDVVLLDLMMPHVSGLEILSEIRSQTSTAALPVIILTASSDTNTMVRALELGATDFITKPVDAVLLIPRVRNALVVKAHHDHLERHARELEQQVLARTADLRQAHRELVCCLARAAEFRDDETGWHVQRVGRYVEIIAKQLGMDEETIDLFGQAALLHDIGKIGVPDAVLHKPGKLDPNEWEIMRRHCVRGKRIMDFGNAAVSEGLLRTHTDTGARILESAGCPVLRVAARIALSHHEKWDGSGYPLGLAGEDIPIESRMTAVADVFDALSTKRCYKPAFPLDKCFSILKEERGRHFDPQMVDALLACRYEILQVQCALVDDD